MFAAVVILSIVAVFALIGIYQKNTNAICKSKKSLAGKTVLVTGGTTGMGLEVALDFAYRDAKVIIACPFEQEGARAKQFIIERTGNEKVMFKLLDLASLKSVRGFAEDILVNEKSLDILINNAGVGIVGDFQTDDGINFMLQVNYFGHFLLTLLLLPLLRKTGTLLEPARIVNTSSILHWIGKFDVKNMNKTGHWFQLQLYGNSKLFLVLFSRELTKRLKYSNVIINTVDPGAVGTRIFDCSGKILGFAITLVFGCLFKSPWEGVQTALYVTLSPKLSKISGEFFKNCKVSRAASWAYCEKSGARLWEESVRLVKLSEEELHTCLNVSL